MYSEQNSTIRDRKTLPDPSEAIDPNVVPAIEQTIETDAETEAEEEVAAAAPEAESGSTSSKKRTVKRKESTRYTPTMLEMPAEERPRERLEKHGGSACSAAELIAILFRTGNSQKSALGMAEELVHQFGGLRGVSQASVPELMAVKGVGKVKAIEIAAAVEIGKRLTVVSEEEKPSIRGPQDVANLMMPELRDERVEHLVALLLDTKNRVIKIVHISKGTLDSSLVHPREVFRQAIAASAAAIIVVHNHPSGDPTPSEEDRRVTTRLVSAGSTIGIDVLDHIIIGLNRWVSMKEKGLM